MQFRNILLFAITAAAAAISANSAGEGLAIRGEDDVHVGTCKTSRDRDRQPHGTCHSSKKHGSEWQGNCDANHACTGDGNHCSISTASGGHVVCS